MNKKFFNPVICIFSFNNIFGKVGCNALEEVLFELNVCPFYFMALKRVQRICLLGMSFEFTKFSVPCLKTLIVIFTTVLVLILQTILFVKVTRSLVNFVHPRSTP